MRGAAEMQAADLRRVADLVESGLLNGRSYQVTFFVESPRQVQEITDVLGGEVARHESAGHLQANNRRARVGTVDVCAILYLDDVPWDAEANDAMAAVWADLVASDQTPTGEVTS